MNNSLDDGKPIFQQIKEQIEDMIINNSIQEGERVPSTNEFANYYKINPATAAKGINQLVDEGVLFKRRGVGMFVSEQAKNILYKKRKDAFIESYIVPLRMEAEKLKISEEELVEIIRGGKQK